MPENQVVRAKFRCTEITKTVDGRSKEYVYRYKFFAVYDGSPENEQYFKYTPSGNLEIGAFKQDLFEPGKEYYLDFIPATV